MSFIGLAVAHTIRNVKFMGMSKNEEMQRHEIVMMIKKEKNESLEIVAIRPPPQPYLKASRFRFDKLFVMHIAKTVHNLYEMIIFLDVGISSSSFRIRVTGLAFSFRISFL